MSIDLVELSRRFIDDMPVNEITKAMNNDENENERTIDRTKCNECGCDVTFNDGLLVCTHCGVVKDCPFVTERYDADEVHYESYRRNKPYSRFKHLLRLIRKINCSRNTTKDNFNVDDTITKCQIEKTDDVDTVKRKINNFKTNQYIVMKRLHNEKYILIDYFLLEQIKSLYAKITDIYFHKLSHPNRKNLLNNYYLLKKILIRLGRKDIADRIHNLKVQKNIDKYDKIYEEIEKYLK